MPDLDNRFGRLRDPGRIDPVEAQFPVSMMILADDTAPSLHTLMNAASDDRGALIFSTIPMLWLVDGSGDIRIALEEVVDRQTGAIVFPKPSAHRLLPQDHGKRGHPALVAGGAGRIGGELFFDIDKGNWVITNKSGRYGSGKDRTADHLKNVADRFGDFGLDVYDFFS